MRHLCHALIALIVLPISAWGQVPSPGGDPLHLLRVASTTPEALASQLRSLHYDVCAAYVAEGQVEIAASLAEEAALQAAGFSPVVVETAQPLAVKLTGGQELPIGYRDLAGIEAHLTAMAVAHPTLAQVVDISAAYGPGLTQEGRRIKALKISDNVSLDEDEPNVLIVALHHAREIVTPEICLDHIDRLLAGYGNDAGITALINDNEIWFIPAVNPDGLDYVWTTNNLWRKNRAPQVGGSIGVDLNRNYDLGWSSACSGSTNPSNDSYKGISVFSEQETKTLRDFSRDRRFAKVLDFHSSGREVLLSYFCSSMATGPEAFIDAEGLSLAATAGYQTRDPSADGEHQEWQMKETTSYAFLAETELEFQPAHANALAEAATLWPLTQAFLGREIPVLGHVRDQVNGNPVEADIEIVNIGWTEGETRTAEKRFGRYHLFLPPGSYQLRYSKPGYVDQMLTLQVPLTSTLIQDVFLVPNTTDVGQSNLPTATLSFSGAVDLNGDAATTQNGPFFATYSAGAPITLEFLGSPGRPFFLLGASLNRNNAVGLVGSLDIGFLGANNDFSDLAVVLNGVAPTSFFDQLAFLSPAGERVFSVPAPPFPGLQLGAFQAWIHQDVGLPLLSAATEVAIQ